MPETIFYTRNGRIAQHFVGEQSRQTFEQAIRAIIAAHVSSKNLSATQHSGN